MTFFATRWMAVALATGVCAPAIADDVLFENVRIFDGTGIALSAPSNVLVKGNLIVSISTASIAAEGALRIAGNGRVLMPGLIDAHWHAMLARTTPAQAFGDVGFNNLVAGDEATDTLMRGFTTVRDVGGPVFGLKRAIDEGIVQGPRIYPIRRHDHCHERAWGFPPVNRSAADDRRHAHPHGAGRWRHSCGQP